MRIRRWAWGWAAACLTSACAGGEGLANSSSDGGWIETSGSPSTESTGEATTGVSTGGLSATSSGDGDPTTSGHESGSDDATTTTGTDDSGSDTGTSTGMGSTGSDGTTGGDDCIAVSFEGSSYASTTTGIFVVQGDGGGLGDPGVVDFVQLEFYTNGTGTFELASNVNDNYASCNQCVRVIEDFVDSETSGREFFQREGSITVDASTPPRAGGGLTATLTDVVLEEVTIDPDNNFVSTPVPGGACLRLVSPFNVQIQ